MKAAANSCGPASSSEDGRAAGDLWVSRGAAYSLPGRCTSGTALMNPISPARPKNLATNTVAWPWASEFSIHCRHGLRMHDSLHPLRRTRHPLQLMMMMIFSWSSQLISKQNTHSPSAAPWSDPTHPSYSKSLDDPALQPRIDYLHALQQGLVVGSLDA